MACRSSGCARSTPPALRCCGHAAQGQGASIPPPADDLACISPALERPRGYRRVLALVELPPISAETLRARDRRDQFQMEPRVLPGVRRNMPKLGQKALGRW